MYFINIGLQCKLLWVYFMSTFKHVESLFIDSSINQCFLLIISGCRETEMMGRSEQQGAL